MTETWQWDADRLRDDLEAAGYDVSMADAHLTTAGGSLRARRDRGARDHLIAIDAGGRFNAVVTVMTEEQSGVTSVARVDLRIIAESRRAVSISGTLTSCDQLTPIIEALDHLADAPPASASFPRPPRLSPDTDE
ncbi:MAG: hypothetical protein H0W59_00030 [Chloroflexia bacterium]|nr:hypothetical protein [Chloroflexia bacterium]